MQNLTQGKLTEIGIILGYSSRPVGCLILNPGPCLTQLLGSCCSFGVTSTDFHSQEAEISLLFLLTEAPWA